MKICSAVKNCHSCTAAVLEFLWSNDGRTWRKRYKRTKAMERGKVTWNRRSGFQERLKSKLLVANTQELSSPQKMKPSWQAWVHIGTEAHTCKMTDAAVCIHGHVDTMRERGPRMLKKPFLRWWAKTLPLFLPRSTSHPPNILLTTSFSKHTYTHPHTVMHNPHDPLREKHLLLLQCTEIPVRGG